MNDKNVKLFAVNHEQANGFDIYLDFSGQREYLMWHRHNGIIYGILKDGINFGEFKRNKPHRLCALYGYEYSGSVSSKLDRIIKHIICNVEEYLRDRQADLVA